MAPIILLQVLLVHRQLLFGSQFNGEVARRMRRNSRQQLQAHEESVFIRQAHFNIPAAFICASVVMLRGIPLIIFWTLAGSIGCFR